ncbi:hypothetical protein [Oceanobacillus sp. CAU 1775]
MGEEIRHDAYVKELLEQRKKEEATKDPINERNLAKGEGLTSPTNLATTEETKVFKQYMDQKNLFQVTEARPHLKKALTLKRFFKMKRNQQVEVYHQVHGESQYTEGKVNAIGRDFVMITNLKNRIWIPYEKIDSANVPYGIPNYSNAHQHYIYDNDLRMKLLQNFGATVSQREILIQQFHEETLRTNLARWKNTWVEVGCDDGKKFFGKIDETTKESITLRGWKHRLSVPLNRVELVKSLRFLKIITQITDSIFEK